MSHDNYQTGKSFNWPACLAIGCGVCLLLITLAFVGTMFTIHKAVSSIISGSPPPAHAPYSYGYASNAASCSVSLPDGSSINYLHMLGDGRGKIAGEGQRAVSIFGTSGKATECPLKYFAPKDVRVGVYWYPADKTSGPYLRLLDSCGETIVDLKRNVTRRVIRDNKRMYAGDIIDEYESISIERSPGIPGGKTIVTYNGKPADDVTSTFAPGKGQHIGSIARIGNKLVYTPVKPSP